MCPHTSYQLWTVWPVYVLSCFYFQLFVPDPHVTYTSVQYNCSNISHPSLSGFWPFCARFLFSALMVPFIYILVLWNHTCNLVPLFNVCHCLLILFTIAFYLFYHHYYYYYFELHHYQMYNDLLSYHVRPSSFMSIDNQSYLACTHLSINYTKIPPPPIPFCHSCVRSTPLYVLYYYPWFSLCNVIYNTRK